MPQLSRFRFVRERGSGIVGAFFFRSRPEQAQRVRDLVNSGLTDSVVAELTHWSVSDIRRAVAESSCGPVPS
jgi:hypothetical protein